MNLDELKDYKSARGISSALKGTPLAIDNKSVADFAEKHGIDAIVSRGWKYYPLSRIMSALESERRVSNVAEKLAPIME